MRRRRGTRRRLIAGRGSAGGAGATVQFAARDRFAGRELRVADRARDGSRERGRGGALRALAAAALWVAAASGAAVGGAGCRGAGAPAMPRFPPGAHVLHLAVQDDVPTLDPAAGYDTASWTFEQMIFDTLVRYSDGGVDLVPEIATSWEESPDARDVHVSFAARRPLHQRPRA